jgi:agmatinase
MKSGECRVTEQKPKMRSMFGGKASGGIFDIPVAEVGNTRDADMVVIGAPCATPYTSVGPYCADAPDAIRDAFGWPGVLEHHDFDVDGNILCNDASAVDWGNLPYDEVDFAANRENICERVKSVLQAGAVPMVLGGDDSIPIPVLRAYGDRGPLTILQLDAHIDWRDEVYGETMGLSSNMRRASEMPWVENIIQVGARGIGSARPSDRQDAIDWGVQFFPMREVARNGLSAIIEAIPENCNLFITLDIDSMDPAVVPAVIGPAPGGLSYWDMVTLLESAGSRAKIVGFDLAELMPSADIGGRGALVAARIVAVIMGLISKQKGNGF